MRLDGRPAKPAAKLRGGETIELEIPAPEPSGLVAQALALAVLHEDRDLLVLDKAAGMVVHPARGSPHSTVVNALLHHLGAGAGAGPAEAAGAVAAEADAADDLARDEDGDADEEVTRRGRAGTAGPGGDRLGLVHRLDRDTSGCLVVAKTEPALAALQKAWKAREVEKLYLALCHGAPPPAGRWETAYGRHPRDRLRFTTRVRSARRAVTDWKVLERFDGASLLELRLHTGRTHQIRVHLADHGFPLLGDATYGGARKEARLPPGHPVRRAAEAAGRQALHAARLVFAHPRTGKRLAFEAPLPPDLRAALEILRAARDRK